MIPKVISVSHMGRHPKQTFDIVLPIQLLLSNSLFSYILIKCLHSIALVWVNTLQITGFLHFLVSHVYISNKAYFICFETKSPAHSFWPELFHQDCHSFLLPALFVPSVLPLHISLCIKTKVILRNTCNSENVT